MRGYISNTNFELQPNEIGKFDVRQAVGNGELTVVRDVGLKTPYVSKVPIISGEIAEDVAYYYTKSEQIPSAFALGVLMDASGVVHAGGLAIQILDRNLPEDVISGIEKRLNGFSISHELEKASLEDIARYVIGDEGLLFEEKNVVFKCSCSREKAYEALKLFELGDLYELLAEGRAEITCKWCSERYEFGSDDIKDAIELKKSISKQE